MKNEISKDLMCILMRNGIEIWLESDLIKSVENVLLSSKDSKFLTIEDQIINTADITGVFNAKTMEDLTRRKNGQWKDEQGWHDRGENKVAPPAYYKKFGM